MRYRFPIFASYLMTALLCGIGMTLKAQMADPAITGVIYQADEVSLNETSLLEISFVNTGFSEIPEASIELTISTPVHYSTDGQTAPTGAGADLFDWTYIQDDVWRGINIDAIDAFQGGQININVTGLNITSTYEMSNVNVQPVDNLSQFNDSSGNNNLQPGLKINSSSVLPVVWKSFDVVNKNDHHFVEWSTSQEINVDAYSLERKLGSDNFEEIYSKKIINQSSTQTKVYDYKDYDVKQSGSYFYRIKQIDIDGKFEYSNIVKVYRDDLASKFKLYPNPTTDRIFVEGDMEDQNVYTCHVVDGEGHAVILKKLLCENRTVNLDISDLHSGVYYFIIIEEGRVLSKNKFIKI